MSEFISSISVNDDEEEARQWQQERDVDSWMSEDDLLVDDKSLQRWHECASYNSHDQKGCSEMSVFDIYIFKGDAVDGGEHDGHEEADGYEAVESPDAFDADGCKGAGRSSYAEECEQLSGVDKSHDVGAEESAHEIE